MSKIGIGICTHKRTSLISNCLMSLKDIERPVDAELCIIIADNDSDGSASQIIDKFRQIIDIPIHYQIEQNRGIPFARNNILRQGEIIGISELAFIDDDETVDKTWLVNLWNYYKKSGADVVRSFVKTIYPPETPKWITEGNFYQRNNFPTGTVFDWAATNNVLFNFDKIVIKCRCFFDESFGLRGGSDLDFFNRSYHSGAVIKWVDNAFVYETLEKKRMRLSYFLKRRFRDHNTVYQTRGGWLSRILRMCKALLKCLYGLIATPFLFFLGKHKAVKSLYFFVDGLAVFLGTVKIYLKWDEYQ